MSVQVATDLLYERIAKAVLEDDTRQLGSPGDEPNTPVDWLRVKPGTNPGKRHPYFRSLIESSARLPSRAVIKEIGPAFREWVPVQELRSTSVGIVSLGSVPRTGFDTMRRRGNFWLAH
jgi:hypothetical protein